MRESYNHGKSKQTEPQPNEGRMAKVKKHWTENSLDLKGNWNLSGDWKMKRKKTISSLNLWHQNRASCFILDVASKNSPPILFSSVCLASIFSLFA